MCFCMGQRKQTTEKTDVFSCIVVDEAGPIQVDLWRDAVNDLQRILANDMEPQTHKLLTFDRLALRPMSSKYRQCVPELYKVSSVKGTVISESDTNLGRAILNKGISCLEGDLLVKDFSIIDMPPTFIASVCGIIASVDEESRSSLNLRMKAFKLNDSKENQLLGITHGRHTTNQQVQRGKEIVVFFCTAQAARNGGRGNLWVHDDCHIILLNVGRPIPKANAVVQVRTTWKPAFDGNLIPSGHDRQLFSFSNTKI